MITGADPGGAGFSKMLGCGGLLLAIQERLGFSFLRRVGGWLTGWGGGSLGGDGV